jgi:uncharacterized glyoxalase superfamily protein PhnB
MITGLAIEGRVVTRSDADWDEARKAWNLAADLQPAAVAFVEGAGEGRCIRATAVRSQRARSAHARPHPAALAGSSAITRLPGADTASASLSVGTGSEAGVEEFVKRAHQADAEIVTEPGRQPWGYAGAFADPDGHVWMVTAELLHA